MGPAETTQQQPTAGRRRFRSCSSVRARHCIPPRLLVSGSSILLACIDRGGSSSSQQPSARGQGRHRRTSGRPAGAAGGATHQAGQQGTHGQHALPSRSSCTATMPSGCRKAAAAAAASAVCSTRLLDYAPRRRAEREGRCRQLEQAHRPPHLLYVSCRCTLLQRRDTQRSLVVPCPVPLSSWPFFSLASLWPRMPTVHVNSPIALEWTTGHKLGRKQNGAGE
jgi:hypothetical protein